MKRTVTKDGSSLFQIEILIRNSTVNMYLFFWLWLLDRQDNAEDNTNFLFILLCISVLMNREVFFFSFSFFFMSRRSFLRLLYSSEMSTLQYLSMYLVNESVMRVMCQYSMLRRANDCEYDKSFVLSLSRSFAIRLDRTTIDKMGVSVEWQIFLHLISISEHISREVKTDVRIIFFLAFTKCWSRKREKKYNWVGPIVI
jgi:hypothetical protein